MERHEQIEKSFEDLEKEGCIGLETSIQTELMKMGERPYEPMQDIPGVPTGLTDLDKLLDGFQPAELTIEQYFERMNDFEFIIKKIFQRP